MLGGGGGMFYTCPSVCPSRLKVCIINSSYSCQAIDLKLCTNPSGILKMCTSLFEEKKIIFDKLTAFLDFEILQFLSNAL